MPATRRSRKRYGIVAASVAAHAVVLGLIALHAPRLHAPPAPPSGPPEPIIPVLIMPRAIPPAAEGGSAPAELRLHRRRTRFSDEELPVAPLIAPTESRPAERPADSAGPRTLPLPRYEDTLADNARKALRGRLNCDSATLTRAEREGCEDRFASGGRDAPFQGLGLDRDRDRELGAAASKREQAFRYRRSDPAASPLQPGVGWAAQRSPPNGAPNAGIGVAPTDLGATPAKKAF